MYAGLWDTEIQSLHFEISELRGRLEREKRKRQTTLLFLFLFVSAIVLWSLDWEKIGNWPDVIVQPICPFEFPKYDPHFHMGNRERLFRLLDSSLSQDTVVVIPTAKRPIRDESDSELFGWKQTANVQYCKDYCIFFISSL